jgi:DNA-binding transcriptional LysR family regulator
MFDELRTSVDEIRFLADPTVGEVRIGSTEPLLAGFGLAVMERVWGGHTRINFRVVEAASPALLTRELPEREIDLAFVPLTGAAIPDDHRATIRTVCVSSSE